MLKNSRRRVVWIVMIGALGVVACALTQLVQLRGEAVSEPSVTVWATQLVPVTVEVTRWIPVTVEVTRMITQVITPTPTALMPTPVVSGQVGVLSGTYVWEASNYCGCILQVIHWDTLEPFDWADFTLSCCRGAPSYNSGEMSGRMIVESDMGVYTYSDETGLREGPCHLVFHFSQDTVEVRQLGMSFDCGFGYGVYANGLYTRRD